jgi:hypothetical protein
VRRRAACLLLLLTACQSLDEQKVIDAATLEHCSGECWGPMFPTCPAYRVEQLTPFQKQGVANPKFRVRLSCLDREGHVTYSATLRMAYDEVTGDYDALRILD